MEITVAILGILSAHYVGLVTHFQRVVAYLRELCVFDEKSDHKQPLVFLINLLLMFLQDTTPPTAPPSLATSDVTMVNFHWLRPITQGDRFRHCTHRIKEMW